MNDILAELPGHLTNLLFLEKETHTNAADEDRCKNQLAIVAGKIAQGVRAGLTQLGIDVRDEYIVNFVINALLSEYRPRATRRPDVIPPVEEVIQRIAHHARQAASDVRR